MKTRQAAVSGLSCEAGARRLQHRIATLMSAAIARNPGSPRALTMAHALLKYR
jgi:hypothetical protein